ncbi:VCBS repeat domain-containing M23 family metallopeptidase [Nocardioides sp. JQ2195]|uniref:peptidoglycan DD-metalloendopeptidase family protein n=1 Tax=Nocardioides sp. JQ2195 TaxID=2592334 RepID=UPI00143E73E1|nr:peptidoglycan DD-metalloendopeptidase family protein [Nocardioides sp. JQ2195]QIX26597.1 VCBS repeat domain-containing M23 family metallopeptidase [Nocardioides sp. JQ2195]
MHVRHTATSVALGTVLLSCLTLAPAQSAARRSAPAADYEMPFPCGQTWTGSTRANHSPSSKAIDWNRADDMGAPVVASAPGVVTTANKVSTGGYGKSVVIDHGNGEDSLYAHLSVVSVSVGQRVDQGMQIGNVGSSGNSTGAHLHFEERKSRTVVFPYLHGTSFVFGSSPKSQNCVDVPLAEDWTGDGIAEPTVFRRATLAKFRIMRPDKPVLVKRLGTATDQPVVGDWDGRGGANPGVYTAATTTFSLKFKGEVTSFVFGTPPDQPVAGDWDGNGRWEVGLWRARKGKFILRSAAGAKTKISLGGKDDLPVTGDWDGDGRTDVGVFDQATARFTLRKVDDEGTVWLGTITYGQPGDLPVTGDWDGNGRTDLGVWSPATAKFAMRRATEPTAARALSISTVKFGRRR